MRKILEKRRQKVSDIIGCNNHSRRKKMLQYQMFTLFFQGDEPQGSWVEIDLHAIFTCNGVKKEISGFYAGDGNYEIRYLPQQTGTIHWKVSGLFETEGEEECVASVDDVYHGLVQPDGIKLRYEDGTLCCTFGTTVYAMMHQPKELIAQTIDTLLHSPFNKLRTCVFPKHYAFNENEPEYFAFEKKPEGGFDFHRPCMPFWKAFDEILTTLCANGIQVDLILFHPYDWWGFSKMTRQEYVPYLTYLLNRLAAYPNLWWSLANEYDCINAFAEEDWDFIDRFIHANDPYGHMLSCHHMLKHYDFGKETVTHCSIQGDVTEVENFIKAYGKPVLMDEFGYEGNIPFHWGNLSAFEEVHRFWLCCVVGGYATHGETFLNDTDTLWWGKGGTLKGESPARIGFFRTILEELPDALEPVFSRTITPEQLELAKSGALQMEQNDFIRALLRLPTDQAVQVLKNMDKDMKAYTGHCGTDAYLAYYGRHCTAVGELDLPEDGSYDVEVLDVWEMTRTPILSGVHGKVEFALPGKEGIAVLAKKRS